MRRTLLLILCLGCGSPVTEPAPLQVQTGSDSLLVIRNARIVTMTNPGVLSGQTVVVRGDRIAALGPAAAVQLPDGATIVDAGGRYLLPGLIDMHVHILTEHLEGYLQHGITSVRNLWGYRELPALINSIHNGARRGPSIYSLSPGFDGSPIRWPQTQLSDDATQIAALIDAQVQQGFRELKVYTNLTRAAFDTIVAITRRRGLTFAGHVPVRVPLEHAIASGQRSIEHLGGYDVEVSTGPWLTVDAAAMRQWAQRSASAGVWNCPTLAVIDMLFTSSPQRATVTQNRQRMVKALHDAGAGLLVGTDTGFDRMMPGSIAEELRLFVAAGLSPYEALLGATRNAARYLQLEGEIGTIAVGARADLVLLHANPLADISAVTGVEAVVLRGRWLPQ